MVESCNNPPSLSCRLQGMLSYYSVLLGVTFLSTVTATTMLPFAEIACVTSYSSLHSLSICFANYLFVILYHQFDTAVSF